MTPEKEVERYCQIRSLVASMVYDNAYAADCFCSLQKPEWSKYWRDDQVVREFIEEAVIKHAAKNSKYSKSDLRATLAKMRALDDLKVP